jgi:pimeloyl-ACP methyl ester carboxylesterase
MRPTSPAAPPLALLLVLALSGCAGLKRQLVQSGIEERREEAGLVAKSADLDGVRTAYLERPGDGPTAVLLHGFGASKDGWLGFAAALPDSFRVLIPDLPGHGDSAADTTRPYDASRLTMAMEAWLDEVAPGPVHVAGNSLGGEVAALLALGRPAQVRTLALFAPAGVASPVPSAQDSLAQRGDLVLVPTDREELDRLYDLAFVRDPDIPGAARDVLAEEAAARAPFLRSLLAELARERDLLRSRLPEIRQPTLLVWGEEDRILDPSAAPIWARGLPDADVLLLPNVGHAPQMEQPGAMANAFADHVLR